ncbi:hypothetical protein ABZX92_15435 [Lentzea sp. NPDC006480]
MVPHLDAAELPHRGVEQVVVLRGQPVDAHPAVIRRADYRMLTGIAGE